MNPRPDRTTRLDFVVFSIGDSRKPSTWSNVPYFFTRTLEQRGHPVHHVDIAPSRVLQLMFDLPWKAYCRLAGRRTKYTFLRSRFNRMATNAKIRKALRRYPNGHCVFMTFSFGTGSSRPYTLFCDQTFAQHIAYFDERTPDKLELPTILEERKNLMDASLIIALFPEVAEELERQHGAKVKYYGNVVNIDRMDVNPELLMHRKRENREIVFIGSRKYKEGLEHLVDAVRILNARGAENVVVNVIGMDRRDMHFAPGNMVFHGYLDKGNPLQNKTYLDVLERSRIFVNPNPKWAAFSASCEALYLCTPVVIFPYREFERTFGDTDRVGTAIRSDRPEEVADAIELLLNNDMLWSTKALAAHEATKAMSWNNYVDRFLTDLDTDGK